MKWPDLNWRPVNLAAAAGVALAAILILVLQATSGWVRLVDDVNLVFHEAGHPIFGVLGENPGLYGGTLMQLLMPAAAAFHFARRGETGAFALMGVWFFENFLNISRYMGDARARVLPLVGGGDHDWTQILAAWHLIQHDTFLARAVGFLGWLGIIATVGWVVRRSFLPRHLSAPDAF